MALGSRRIEVKSQKLKLTLICSAVLSLSVDFVSWQSANQISAIDWTISSAPGAGTPAGTIYGSGTASVSSSVICTTCARQYES